MVEDPTWASGRMQAEDHKRRTKAAYHLHYSLLDLIKLSLWFAISTRLLELITDLFIVDLFGS